MSLQNPLRLTRGGAVAALVLVAGGLVPLFGQAATPKQKRQSPTSLAEARLHRAAICEHEMV